MGNSVHALDDKTARQRMDSFVARDGDDAAMLKHLYDLGMEIVSEAERRTDKLDSRSNQMILWVGALVAFLVSQLGSMKPPDWAGVIFAVVMAVTAGALAFSALRVRGGWKWFSEDVWVPGYDEYQDLKGLLAYHIVCARQITETARQINSTKANRIFLAQVAILLAVLSLAELLLLRVLLP